LDVEPDVTPGEGQEQKERSMRKLQLTIMAAIVAGAMSASAALVFTTEASFLTAINPGYYLNDFGDVTGVGVLSSPRSYSGGSGPFSYDISSSSGYLYGVLPGGNPAMSTGFDSDILTVSFTSGNVTAVGGLFFLTDDPGAATSGTVKVDLSDSTSQTFAAGSFRGFVTSAGGPVITSLSLDSLTTGAYPTLDHLYAGTTPVPEPTTMIAGALLLLPFGASTFRFFRKNRTA
jgi:hypothetical protein